MGPAGRRAASRWELLRWAFARLDLGEILRAVMIALGLRRTTPRPGELVATTTTTVPDPGDTGGGFRAKWRMQDPAKDPEEPNGGESSSRGEDHGWSGCSMTSGAVAMAYAAHYAGRSKSPWGGDLRHSGQSDMEGGTDLYDVRDAFNELGEEITIKSGAGWSAVKTAHADKRAIVIQGSGNVPGSATFTGGHACCIGPETNGDGEWLWGDPLVTDWQWVPPSKIEDWAKAWSSGISYAQTAKPPAAPPPDEPDCPDCPECPPDVTPYDAGDVAAAEDAAVVAAGDAAVGVWLDWLRAPRPGAADAWGVGAWADLGDVLAVELEDSDPCPEPEPGTPARWAKGRVPSPVWDAYEAMTTASTWGLSEWRATTWAS